MDLVTQLWEVSPWFQMGWAALGLALVCWLLSVLTDEYSWVDRVWSVAPPVFALYLAGAAGFADPRLNLMAVLITAWGARLTFNFARKGGYWKGGEDYRWAYVRARMNGWQWQVFNFGFTHLFQLALIWGFTAPLHFAWLGRGTPLGLLDAVAGTLFAALLVLETVADEQMWRFQRDKQRRLANGETVAQGFYSGGLYRLSRHPNYFGEMGQWWVLGLFGIAATGAILTWMWLPVVVLTALFMGSTRLAEQISASKYPGYAAYQRATSVWIPWFPRDPSTVAEPES